MQIVSENIILKNTNEFSSEYIESELASRNLDVVRWAIIDIQEDVFTVCVSHVTI